LKLLSQRGGDAGNESLEIIDPTPIEGHDSNHDDGIDIFSIKPEPNCQLIGSTRNCKRGLLLIDNFSPYHGGYISQTAQQVYGVGIVDALSTYVAGYLYQEKGMIDLLSGRIPLDPTKSMQQEIEQVHEWRESIPFDIVGIICESDSGLDEAERLGVIMGLFPDRHNGYNRTFGF